MPSHEKLLPLSLALMIRELLASYPCYVGGEKHFFSLVQPGYEARGLLACNLHTAAPNAKSDLQIVFMDMASLLEGRSRVSASSNL